MKLYILHSIQWLVDHNGFPEGLPKDLTLGGFREAYNSKHEYGIMDEESHATAVAKYEEGLGDHPGKIDMFSDFLREKCGRELDDPQWKKEGDPDYIGRGLYFKLSNKELDDLIDECFKDNEILKIKT